MRTKVMEALKDSFKPEFLNRLDEIIIFNILAKEAIKEIVDIQIGVVKKRLLEKEIELSVSDGVLKFLAEEGYDPSYGARPLKRLIQSKILTPLASMMISNNIMSGGKVMVGFSGKDFTFEIKKGKKKVVSKNLKTKGAAQKALPGGSKKKKKDKVLV